MTNKEALEILQKKTRCINGSCGELECRNCPNDCDDIQLMEAIDTAISALELCVIVEDEG